MNTAFFSDILATIADRGRSLLGLQDEAPAASARETAGLLDLCEALLSGRGEASGAAISREILEHYARLEPAAKLAFFEALARDYGPDRKQIDKALEAFRANPTEVSATDIHFLAEPRRQELFRRLNRAPGATALLVRLREELLDFKRENPALETVDRCLSHLFTSWFNRGFLVLRRIDWSTPANILEKIIRYEAVHEIRDWDDLRRRIDPADRRCYAFFHPALVDEPLIFVEVALTDVAPAAIEPLLSETRAVARVDKARTAVFYSISNCQQGLASVSFGSFLIKQVVEELRRDMPKLETFVTLSPAPGFMKWAKSRVAELSAEDRALVAELGDSVWAASPEKVESLRKPVEALAADYFLQARGPNGRPVDPVARFHLGNGARLERINFLGDRSLKALREAGGLMVNYLYQLDEIEKNHEAYANQRVVTASSAVRRLQRGAGQSRLQLPNGSSS